MDWTVMKKLDVIYTLRIFSPIRTMIATSKCIQKTSVFEWISLWMMKKLLLKDIWIASLPFYPYNQENHTLRHPIWEEAYEGMRQA